MFSSATLLVVLRSIRLQYSLFKESRQMTAMMVLMMMSKNLDFMVVSARSFVCVCAFVGANFAHTRSFSEWNLRFVANITCNLFFLFENKLLLVYTLTFFSKHGRFFISLLLLFHILFRWRWLLLLVLVCSQCFCVQQINFFLRIYAVLMFRNNWNDVKSARTRSSSKGKKWITHLSISADWSARVFFSFPFCWCVGQHLMCCCGSLLACMRITIRSWMLLMFLKLKICKKWMIFITLLLAAFFLLLPQVFSGWLSYRILHQIGRMNCWRTQKNAHFYWLWVEKTVFFINDNAQIRYFLHNSIKSNLWLTVAW